MLRNHGIFDYKIEKGGSYPTDGLILHLDANDLLLDNSTAVSTWYDTSGLGNNATQATLSAKPIFFKNIQKGMPALYWKGAQSLATSLTISNKNLTIFSANKNTGLNCECVVGHNSPDSYIKFHYGQIWKGGVNRGAGIIKNDTEAFEDVNRYNTWVQQYATVDNNNLIKRSSNKSAVVSSTINYTANFNVYIGGGGYRPFYGYIGEILIYNRAVSSEEITQLENYLYNKWI